MATSGSSLITVVTTATPPALSTPRRLMQVTSHTRPIEHSPPA